MKKPDGLKVLVAFASENYILGFCPARPRIYDQVEDKSGIFSGVPAPSGPRLGMLLRGLDVKTILEEFLDDLTKRHGAKRVDRLLDWLKGRWANSFSHWHQLEIKADRKRLASLIRERIGAGYGCGI